jgi:hypothetical protein
MSKFMPAQKKHALGPQFHAEALSCLYEIIFTKARLIILYAFLARIMDFARRRVDGISETMAYTTGATEKSATAESNRTIVPAVHDVAVDGVEGIPIPPATLRNVSANI